MNSLHFVFQNTFLVLILKIHYNVPQYPLLPSRRVRGWQRRTLETKIFGKGYEHGRKKARINLYCQQ